MNRRDALKLGLAAPFAAPAIAKAAMDAVTGPRFGRMAAATIRLDVGGIDATLNSASRMRAISASRFVTPAEIRALEDLPAVADINVEAQMLEHDLFEPKEFSAAAHRSAA